MNGTDDTIVAVSSPPGRSPRGLIRLSGAGTAGVLSDLLEPSTQDTDELQGHGRLVVRRGRLNLSSSEGRSALDQRRSSLPLLVARFHQPKTYTGQDMAEIQCPGNPVVLNQLLMQATKAGARLAEPGEFTYRAFLSGKLDLTQAEGVAATIAASSESRLKAARRLQRGEVKNQANQLVEELAGLLALTEAGIDFVDQEDVVPITAADLHAKLTALAKQLDQTRQRSSSGTASWELTLVVLVGPPNVGKSTLFNALLNRERAVTSSIAGTTRDVLEEPLTLESPTGQRVELLLIDLAGIDNPERVLDKEAQSAALDAISTADLAIVVSDHTTGRSAGYTVPQSTPCLWVRTKADLMPPKSTPGHLESPNQVMVCADSGLGMQKLREAITVAVLERTTPLNSDQMLLPRHEATLRACAEHLQAAWGLSAPSPDNRRGVGHSELVAAELRMALDHLGSLTGQVTPDDIIGRIFQTFCIGK